MVWKHYAHIDRIDAKKDAPDKTKREDPEPDDQIREDTEDSEQTWTEIQLKHGRTEIAGDLFVIVDPSKKKKEEEEKNEEKEKVEDKEKMTWNSKYGFTKNITCHRYPPFVNIENFFKQWNILKMLTNIWGESDFQLDVCHVTNGAHIEY